MYELITNLQKLKELPQPEPSYFVLDSIITGKTPAKIYVDNLAEPTLSLVWEGHNVFFGGSLSNGSRQVVEFFKNVILTDEVKQKLYLVKLFSHANSWGDLLVEMMPEFNPRVAERTLLRHDLKVIPSFPCTDETLQIKAIDRALLEANLEHGDGVIDEVTGTWGSPERFLADGFGYCAVKDDSIATWCTAEYMSAKYCGIGVETYEEYQQQGIGTHTVLAAIQRAKELNLTPHWDAWKKNIPSVKLALKVGFEQVQDYSIILIFTAQ